jgi:hypothetical protein
MCNVQLPLGFSMHAPATTLPAETSVTKTLVHASETKKPVVTEKPVGTQQHHTDEGTKKPVTHQAAPSVTPSVAKSTATGRESSTVPPSLFEVGSPQKVAALVLGSFIAILLLVGGIVFLGFAFVSSPATAGGSRSVMEPYNQV